MKDFITKNKISLLSGCSIVFMIVLWQIATVWLNLPLILPSPQETWKCLSNLLVSSNFWYHFLRSVCRGLVGFLISLFLGGIVGFWIGFNDSIAAFFRPLIVLLRSTPTMTFILLALIWFQSSWVPVFVIFLVAFPMIVENLVEGIHNINHSLIEMVQVYRISLRQRFTNLYLPSVRPYLMAGIAGALGMTWKVLIAAEVLSAPTWGIGTQMDTAHTYLQTDVVFAWTVPVIAIGLLFECLLNVIKRNKNLGAEDNHVPD